MAFVKTLKPSQGLDTVSESVHEPSDDIWGVLCYEFRGNNHCNIWNANQTLLSNIVV